MTVSSTPVPASTLPLTPAAVSRKDLRANFWLALAIALVATVAVYIVFLPFQGTYLGQLLLARGWTQPMALFFAWAVLIFTLLKAIALVQQFPSLRQNWVPVNYPFSSPRDVAHLQQTLAQRRGILPNRCSRVLAAFLTSEQRAIAAEVAAEDSGSAAAAMDASYTIPRVLVWAIPLLGFIGTVVGISQAVSGFSSFLDTAQDVNQIKEGIGSVTTGLAVAFDTTLVALVLSVFVMIPLVAVERWEAKFLLQIDTYINDQLLPRLPVGAPPPALAPESLQTVVQEVIRAELPNPETLMAPATERLEQLVQNLSQLAQAIASDRQQFLTTLTAQQHSSEAAFQQLLEQLYTQQVQLLGRVNQEHTAIGQELHQYTQHLAQLLAQNEQQLQQRLALVEQLRDALNALAETGSLQLVLQTLNHTLASLQPVLKQLSQPRRVTLVEQPGTLDS
ncbi:MotA/TolQ/ExbB proton channel family protein [Thermosynechococcaceae cyanobacterium Okahandja]